MDNDRLISDNLDMDKFNFRKRVRTFVEVSFQENSVKTTCLDGNTPFWKQSLSLPFRPPQNDFTPARLQQVREFIHFTLFDEIVVDDKNRGGYLEGETTIRVDRRYLGYLTVPFSTVLESGRIDGVFRCVYCLSLNDHYALYISVPIG